MGTSAAQPLLVGGFAALYAVVKPGAPAYQSLSEGHAVPAVELFFEIGRFIVQIDGLSRSDDVLKVNSDGK